MFEFLKRQKAKLDAVGELDDRLRRGGVDLGKLHPDIRNALIEFARDSGAQTALEDFMRICELGELAGPTDEERIEYVLNVYREMKGWG